MIVWLRRSKDAILKNVIGTPESIRIRISVFRNDNKLIRMVDAIKMQNKEIVTTFLKTTGESKEG